MQACNFGLPGWLNFRGTRFVGDNELGNYCV